MCAPEPTAEPGQHEDSPIWTFPEGVTDPRVLEGMDVEALDGDAGKVTESVARQDASYIVVDTGSWLSNRHVYIPAGCVEGVDVDDGRVRVALNKDQIDASPEFDQEEQDEPFVDTIAGYYAPILRK